MTWKGLYALCLIIIDVVLANIGMFKFNVVH